MFRFTIRDVLWLTGVVAMLAAFLGARYRESRAAQVAEIRAVEAEKRAIEAIKKETQ